MADNEQQVEYVAQLNKQTTRLKEYLNQHTNTTEKEELDIRNFQDKFNQIKDKLTNMQVVQTPMSVASSTIFKVQTP